MKLVGLEDLGEIRVGGGKSLEREGLKMEKRRL